MYLPRIGDQIKKARNLFNRAIKANNYAGDYNYCYCTKCCHFHHVIGAALKQKVHLETSSSFDIDLIEKLIAERVQAKKDKNFSRADQIRDELLTQGVVLEDARSGTTWRRE